MYTRIALGKNAAMDVVSGESSGGYGQLLILYPMLFALQAFQLLIGESIHPPGWSLFRLTLLLPHTLSKLQWDHRCMLYS